MIPVLIQSRNFFAGYYISPFCPDTLFILPEVTGRAVVAFGRFNPIPHIFIVAGMNDVLTLIAGNCFICPDF
jgi:hypothetical protein